MTCGRIALSVALLALVTLGLLTTSRDERGARDEAASRRVRASATESAARTHNPAAPPATSTAEPEPRPGIRGVVVDLRGSPLSGVAIVAVSYPWRTVDLFDRAARNRGVRRAETTSDEEGRFFLPAVPGEILDVEF